MEYASPDKPVYWNGVDQETGEEIYAQEVCHGWSRLGEEQVDPNRPGYKLVRETGDAYRLKPTHGRDKSAAEGNGDLVEVDENASTWNDWLSGKVVEPWIEPVALGPRNGSSHDRYKNLFISVDDWKPLSNRDKKRFLPDSQRKDLTLPDWYPATLAIMLSSSPEILSHWIKIFDAYEELRDYAKKRATWNPDHYLSPMPSLSEFSFQHEAMLSQTYASYDGGRKRNAITELMEEESAFQKKVARISDASDYGKYRLTSR
jgi:hypothetical protein